MDTLDLEQDAENFKVWLGLAMLNGRDLIPIKQAKKELGLDNKRWHGIHAMLGGEEQGLYRLGKVKGERVITPQQKSIAVCQEIERRREAAKSPDRVAEVYTWARKHKIIAYVLVTIIVLAALTTLIRNIQDLWPAPR